MDDTDVPECMPDCGWAMQHGSSPSDGCKHAELIFDFWTGFWPLHDYTNAIAEIETLLMWSTSRKVGTCISAT